MSLDSSISATARLGDLSRVLWRQRQLIELLEYRLEVQQLLQVSGRNERLVLAVADVETALGDIGASEVERLGIVAECSVALGLDVGASLRELTGAAPEPWNYVLADHQTALLAAVATTEALASANRELANKGLGDARRALEHLGSTTPTTAYGRHGDRPALALPPTLVDRDA